MKKVSILLSFLLPIFLFAQAPNWSINPALYQYNMTVVAKVHLDLNEVNSPGNQLAAFVGAEIRGIATPVIVNGNAYYFLSIYSNQIASESISFKVYLDNENQVFDALEDLPFQSDGNVGSIGNCFPINVSIYNDWPIHLNPLNLDTILEGLTLDTLFLESLLETIDNDPVNWSISPNSGMAQIVNNEYLLVEGNEVGLHHIQITASEVGNTQNFSATTSFQITVLEDYVGPEFTLIPPQLAVESVFPDGDLNNYVNFQGTNIQFDYKVEPLVSNSPSPNWNPPFPGPGFMSIIMQVNYQSLPFESAGELAAYVNGSLAGSTSATLVGGAYYYFLSLANVGSGPITFEFYDSINAYLYTVPSQINFDAGATLGNPANPITVEAAPILVQIDSLGAWQATVIDSSFNDPLIVDVIAEDAKFTSKRDTEELVFLQSQCIEETVSLCSGEIFCAGVDSTITQLLWIKDGVVIGDGDHMAIQEPGDYAYYGVNQSGQIHASCILKVVEGNNCTGSFSSIDYEEIEIAGLGPITDIVIDTLQSEAMSTQIEWTGNNNSTDWFDPLNWESAVLPKACQHVIIPSNKMVQLSDLEPVSVWSLETGINAQLILESNSNLSLQQY